MLACIFHDRVVQYGLLMYIPDVSSRKFSRHYSPSTVAQVSGLSVGSRVVRGPSWEYGDQDGGAGSPGTIVEITSWKGQEGRGVKVHWDCVSDNSIVNQYRWGFEGREYTFFVTEVY